MESKIKERRLRHPVSDKMLKEIGDFIVTYSLVENQMRNLAFFLTQKNTRSGKVVVDALPTNTLKAIIISAMDESDMNIKDIEMKIALKKFISEYQKFIDERNKRARKMFRQPPIMTLVKI